MECMATILVRMWGGRASFVGSMDPKGDEVCLCRLPTAGRSLLKDQLVNVVANALYYNPVLALQQLQAQGRTQAFFTTWFQVSIL